MKKDFKRVIAVALSVLLVLGTVTGCKKDQKPVNDEIVTTATPVPDQAVDIPTATPELTQTPEVTDIPDDSQPTEGENPSDTGVADIEIPNDSDNYIIREFNEFLRGEVGASGMNDVSDIFKKQEDYYIYEIGTGFAMELNDRFLDRGWELSAMDYAVIDCEYDGNPDLLVTFTYETADGYDSPYQETMVFTDDMGWLYYVGSFTNYYREFSTINEAGYCCNGGSSGANISSCSYYFLQGYGYKRFMHSEYDIFGISEPMIPQMYLPSDTTVTRWSDEYSDNGGFLEIVSFNENSGDDYDAYLRECYYTFMDFDGNPVMADADYIAECAADGIRVVSGEEMERIIKEKEDEYCLTEEIKNAPEVTDWAPVPKEYWKSDVGVFANLNAMVKDMDMWLDSEGEEYTCYAVTDIDFNRHFELIRATMDAWTGDTYLSFYEVNDDYSGLKKLDYEDQFTYDGDIDGHQPNIVNSEEIREYSGSDGIYYYVIPSTFYYDTLMYSNAVNQNMILGKSYIGDRVEYKGYSGGVDWYTEYNPDDPSEILTESARYYRWDDSECTKEEYERINKDYFEFDPEGYNVMNFNFIPMMVDSEDDETDCFRYLLNSFLGWGGRYVYSPDGK